MRSTHTFLTLSAFVAVVAAGVQLESNNIGFPNKGTQGCIAASSKTAGSPLVIHDCNTGDASNYDWDIVEFPTDPTPQQIKLFGQDLCVDVQDGVNADGTKLQLWTCTAGNTNQLWSHTSSLGIWQWAGTNKCIDLTDGNVNDGNQLQVWTCDENNRNQQFPGRTVSDSQSVTVTLEGGPDLSPEPRLCLAATENSDGAKVALAPCDNVTSTFPSGNATWVVPRANLAGVLSTFGGSKCLDLRNGDVTNGNALQIWSCDVNNGNQVWKVESLVPKGSATIDFGGLGGKCVDIRDGNFTAGADLQIWDCDASGNNLNQRWIARQ
ncbi:ricin B-like lectin [Marasmius fiardii PR-910]|nr:ricin B-like lectin [Marasmius fiardii PR-910]